MEVRRLRLRINVGKLCSVAVMRFSMAITVLNYAFLSQPPASNGIHITRVVMAVRACFWCAIAICSSPSPMA